MYTYKLKINKVKGSLNESVRRNGLTLRIKSPKKLSENALFEKADSYLNENYGVRLVESHLHVYKRPENDMENDWAIKELRMGGNTKIKNNIPPQHYYEVGDLADDEYKPTKKKFRGKKHNTLGLACYAKKYFFNASNNLDEIEIEKNINKDKKRNIDEFFMVPIDGRRMSGINLEKFYKMYKDGKISPNEWKNILINACEEYSKYHWVAMRTVFSVDDYLSKSKIDENGTVTVSYWNYRGKPISFKRLKKEIENIIENHKDFNKERLLLLLETFDFSLIVTKIKVMDCKNKRNCKEILNNTGEPIEIPFN